MCRGTCIYFGGCNSIMVNLMARNNENTTQVIINARLPFTKEKRIERNTDGNLHCCVFLFPLFRAPAVQPFIAQPTQALSSWVAAERSHHLSEGMQNRKHKSTPRSAVIRPLSRAFEQHSPVVSCYDWRRHLLLGQYHTAGVISWSSSSTEDLEECVARDPAL